ncbi:MAG: hypothetical protein ACOC4B_02375 [Bacteroidota bacterium]
MTKIYLILLIFLTNCCFLISIEISERTQIKLEENSDVIISSISSMTLREGNLYVISRGEALIIKYDASNGRIINYKNYKSEISKEIMESFPITGKDPQGFYYPDLDTITNIYNGKLIEKSLWDSELKNEFSAINIRNDTIFALLKASTYLERYDNDKFKRGYNLHNVLILFDENLDKIGMKNLYDPEYNYGIRNKPFDFIDGQILSPFFEPKIYYKKQKEDDKDIDLYSIALVSAEGSINKKMFTLPSVYSDNNLIDFSVFWPKPVNSNGKIYAIFELRKEVYDVENNSLAFEIELPVNNKDAWKKMINKKLPIDEMLTNAVNFFDFINTSIYSTQKGILVISSIIGDEDKYILAHEYNSQGKVLRKMRIEKENENGNYSTAYYNSEENYLLVARRNDDGWIIEFVPWN